MNDSNPTSLPPIISSSISPTSPLGESPDDRVPVAGIVGAIEAILRQPRRVMFQLGNGNAGALLAVLLALTVVCTLAYGVVVGTFSGGTQLWAAPLKIVAGLLISALICLPSLYIFSCLGGSTARLVEVIGLLAGLLALMTVLLIGFAPVAWVFSQSTSSLPVMGALHLFFWFIATCFGLRFLCAGFAHQQIKSTAGLNVWIVIFLLVAVQMTTALRPILGRADTLLPTEKKFFLQHWSACMDKRPPKQ
ncbi:MAG: hypothetical protein HY043_05580 [Verrucomicrobia bacterium]|nr:hypothetical protein [Verrucomicrobiota bacterium]